MKKINIRSKGASGERQACKWLLENFGIEAERNLDQTRSGGADIITHNTMFEVKRAEAIALRKWWIQVKTAAKYTGHLPVVMFRPNNAKWEFLVSAELLGLDRGFMRLDEITFIMFYNKYLEDTFGS